MPCIRRYRLFCCFTAIQTMWKCVAAAGLFLCVVPSLTLGADFHAVIRDAQRKVVKIYGAGGVRGLEATQSGILISAEGRVLTVLSYVLDTDDLAVVLDDGQKYSATTLGIDPVRELAVLQLNDVEEALPSFDLTKAAQASVGDRILALSNLYNIAAGAEPVSALQGVVTAIAPLSARRGSFLAAYQGPVYVLDAAVNNPGAGGGAVVDWSGRLIGLIGKELKSTASGGWLNYALPIHEIAEAVDRLSHGDSPEIQNATEELPVEPLSLAKLGIVLVPNVLARTPPFVDAVFPGSPAAEAGVKADDLIVFVDDQPAVSCDAVIEAVQRRESFDPVRLALLRGGEVVDVKLMAPPKELTKTRDGEREDSEPGPAADESTE